MSEHLQRGPAIWIVAGLQNLAHDFFGLLKPALYDLLLGNFNAALTKPGERVVVRFCRSDRVRQKIQGVAKLIMRENVIFRLQRGLRASESFRATRQA